MWKYHTDCAGKLQFTGKRSTFPGDDGVFSCGGILYQANSTDVNGCGYIRGGDTCAHCGKTFKGQKSGIIVRFYRDCHR